MQRGFLAFGAVVVLAGGMVFGQAATEAPPAPAPAPAPVAQVAAPTTAPAVRVNTAIIPNLNQGFQNRHTQFLEVAKAGNIDVLFMGDSITDWWRSPGRPPGQGGGPGGNPNRPAPPPLPEGVIANAGKAVFDKHFADWKVANFGIAGDTTQGVLWRLQNGEAAGYTPKAIMLMIGTNNAGRNTAEEIAMGVTAVVHEMRKTWPEAKILLLGIFPRSRPGDPVRAKIATINSIIQTLHDEQHVWYVDISDKFLAPDGTIPRDIMADGLHPTSKGYEIWAEAVKPTLEKLKQ